MYNRLLCGVVRGEQSPITSLKRSSAKMLVCSILGSGLLLASCGSSSGSSPTPSPTNTQQVSIDAMTAVPVINGSSTQGTLYVHNYGNQTATGLNFGLSDQTVTSKVKGLLSQVGFDIKVGAVNKAGFTLLNAERCISIPAGGSCAINFSTPGLVAGDKGNSLVSLSYKVGNNSYNTNQVVNYQYTSLSALSGVNFTGGLNVVGSQGSTQHVVGYLYGGGSVGDKYTSVNLNSSSGATGISNGFINGQEVGSGQVIAVEFAVNMQGNKAGFVDVVPTWGGVKVSHSLNSNNNSASGSVLSLNLNPQQNQVNYIFGTIPLLQAPATTPVVINVANNGNADAPSGITATSDNAALIIGGTCQSTSLQANATNSCTFTFSESSYTPGSATVTFKEGSSTIGTQTVIWTNSTPVPAVSLIPSQSSFSIGKGVDQSESSISFAITNVGNAPLNGITYPTTNTGPASWTQDGTTCGTSIAPGASCSITGHFTGGDDGIGVFYQKSLGNYSTTSYSFISLPIRYEVTAAPSLVITPASVQNLTLLANGVDAESITYTVQNTGNDPALVTNVFESYSVTTESKPIISGGTCSSAPFMLNENESCTIVVTYGPASINLTANESGIATLNLAYHGGTPDTDYTVQSANLNYNLVGNDSSLTIGNPTAPNISGNGTSNNPFKANPTLDPMTITIPYTNNSSNYAMSGFNLATSNLPFGMVVDPSSTCATGESTMTLESGATCNLVLKIDPSLLVNSPTGGSSVLDFAEPTASWTTPLGFYSQSGSQVYANYLQPTITFTLSNNQGNFESTVLTMGAVNESMATTLHGKVWSTAGWLESAPVLASSNCTVNQDTSIICDLKSTNSGSVTYVMPNYMQAGESANIPLAFSTSAGEYAYLNPSYTFINYINTPVVLPSLLIVRNGGSISSNNYYTYTASIPQAVGTNTIVTFIISSNAYSGTYGFQFVNTNNPLFDKDASQTSGCTILSGEVSCTSGGSHPYLMSNTICPDQISGNSTVTASASGYQNAVSGLSWGCVAP